MKTKELRSQLKILEVDAQVLKLDISTKQTERNVKLNAIIALKHQLDKFEVKVSDHAMVRYLERVKSIDISVIEKEILTDDVLAMVNQLGGTGMYPIGEGFKIRMKDYTVVTIM